MRFVLLLEDQSGGLNEIKNFRPSSSSPHTRALFHPATRRMFVSSSDNALDDQSWCAVDLGHRRQEERRVFREMLHWCSFSDLCPIRHLCLRSFRPVSGFSSGSNGWHAALAWVCPRSRAVAFYRTRSRNVV
ncbi:hypothetical protein OF83DRAFT_684507 [Amylostereum chailletii]|nr:hypothetical protein OF83DRAFT_684507 [Amylostereum chailletii]